MTFLDFSTSSFSFCPGCSHENVLLHLNQAMSQAGLDQKQTVLVTDIGCHGVADKFFRLHTLHGLHGRSFTYACGAKLANPKLNVLVLVGDGGCGIGGHHLLNAARRNIGIKVFCFNNFNFGMTGGEHSVTSPMQSITHSTPQGNIERPFDLCALVLAAQASWVGRTTAFENDQVELMSKALLHPGFAFLDILELCPAYYSKLNKYNKQSLYQMVADQNLQLGILKQDLFPELAQTIHNNLQTNPKAYFPVEPIQPKFRADLTEDCSIVLAGSAGQKIISAASLLAKAALSCKLFATQQNEYGIMVQKGHSISELKISSQKIFYPAVSKPQAIIITSLDGLEKCQHFFARLSKKDLVIITSDCPEISTKAQVHKLDIKDLGLLQTTKIIALIAYLLQHRKIIPAEAFKSMLNEIPQEKIREENLKAYEAGNKL
ncbi:MAG: thiamine pyrophosphate-dependent enzyme [Pseudomonadota bacterium]